MSCPSVPVELEMRGGRVTLSLTMRQLYAVWRRWPSVWREFNRIVSARRRTLDDMARLLYAASCCTAVAEGREPAHASIEAFEADMTGDLGAAYAAYVALTGPKESTGFRDAFEQRTRRVPGGIRLPKLRLEEPDDYYVYMVEIVGMSEGLFWDADFAFLWDVASGKAAHDAWLAGERERRSKR